MSRRNPFDELQRTVERMGRQFEETSQRAIEAAERRNRDVNDTARHVSSETTDTTEQMNSEITDTVEHMGSEITDSVDHVSSEVREAAGESAGNGNAGTDQSLSGVEVDVADREDELVVMADLPGFDREEIDATLSGGTLRIVADHEESTKSVDETYLRRERRRNSVRRSIALPGDFVNDEATAEYENGVLTVSVPRADSNEDSHTVDIN